MITAWTVRQLHHDCSKCESMVSTAKKLCEQMNVTGMVITDERPGTDEIHRVTVSRRRVNP